VSCVVLYCYSACSSCNISGVLGAPSDLKLSSQYTPSQYRAECGSIKHLQIAFDTGKYSDEDAVMTRLMLPIDHKRILTPKSSTVLYCTALCCYSPYSAMLYCVYSLT